MARFEYSALSAAGDIVSGELDGSDASAIIERLHEQALLPIHAIEKRPETSSGFSFRACPRRRVLRDAISRFEPAAGLLKAKVPLTRRSKS
jgi:type II secretory pathway component PulF